MIKIYLSFFMVISILNCSGPVQDKNIPPNLKEHRHLMSEEGRQKYIKWKRLAETLKVPWNFPHPEDGLTGKDYEKASFEEFKNQLKQPTGYFNPEHRKEYTEIVESFGKEFAQKKARRQCKAILQVAPWNPKDPKDPKETNFKMFHMTYQLRKDKQTIRSAYLSIPKAKGSYPLIIYGHGGDNGLSYQKELASYKVIMTDHIFAAPTFPGEPWCEDRPLEGKILCNAAGTVSQANEARRSPWKEDADEVLGLHDCFNRFPKKIPGYSAKIKNLKFKNPLINRLIKERPQTIFMGFSRGGLTMSIALAKVGGEWANFESTKEFPPMIGNIVWIAAPSSLLLGTFRFLLHLAVKDQLLSTIGSNLPGVEDLNHLFQKYREDQHNDPKILEKLKREILSRDAIFLAPLILGGLKNWEKLQLPEINFKNMAHITKEALQTFPPNANGVFNQIRAPMGHTLWLHGQEDQVVQANQSLAMVFSLKLFSEDNDLQEKTKMSPDSYQPYFRTFSYPQNLIKPKNSIGFQHGDEHFFQSKSAYPKEELDDLYKKPFPLSNLPGEPPGGGDSPIGTLKRWLTHIASP